MHGPFLPEAIVVVTPESRDISPHLAAEEVDPVDGLLVDRDADDAILPRFNDLEEVPPDSGTSLGGCRPARRSSRNTELPPLAARSPPPPVELPRVCHVFPVSGVVRTSPEV